MPLLDQIQKDLVAAMKAKDESRLSTVRMIKTALMKYQADNPGKPLDDTSEQQILKSLVKQRMDSADMFRKGGRPEMADKEDAERAQIESYLPAAASSEDMDAAIAAAMEETPGATMKQMGAIIKAAQAKLAGKTIDGRTLSDRVKAKLA